MRTVNSRQLRDNLAEHLDAVQAGERVVITRRGRPIAEIVRASQAPPSKEVTAAMKNGSVRRPGDAEGLRQLLREQPEGRAVDLVEQILADRGP